MSNMMSVVKAILRINSAYDCSDGWTKPDESPAQFTLALLLILDNLFALINQFEVLPMHLADVVWTIQNIGIEYKILWPVEQKKLVVMIS